MRDNLIETQSGGQAYALMRVSLTLILGLLLTYRHKQQTKREIHSIKTNSVMMHRTKCKFLYVFCY